jgi:hypothetical protein
MVDVMGQPVLAVHRAALAAFLAWGCSTLASEPSGVPKDFGHPSWRNPPFGAGWLCNHWQDYGLLNRWRSALLLPCLTLPALVGVDHASSHPDSPGLSSQGAGRAGMMKSPFPQTAKSSPNDLLSPFRQASDASQGQEKENAGAAQGLGESCRKRHAASERAKSSLQLSSGILAAAGRRIHAWNGRGQRAADQTCLASFLAFSSS